jgi:hypothetical protein
VPVFDQVQDAIKVALANTLHDLFLYGAAIVVVAATASVFLRDVPLRARSRREEAEVGAPVASFAE